MSTRSLLPACIAFLTLVPVFVAPACTPETRQYGGGDSSSSSSSGGSQCAVNSDCGANSECQAFTCANGTCTVVFAPMGMAVATQGIGDCKSNVCDGKGYVVSMPDAMDPTDDGNPCTLDACVGTDTQHGNLASGMSCNGSQYCDGVGHCVECVDNTQCSSSICKQGACATAECSDAVKNGLETDVDCGGLQCAACPVGLMCTGDPDCKSHVCTGGTCAAPTCMDNVLNGVETAVDCGGPDCLACPTGQTCNAGLDCQSKVCYVGICQDATCDDQVLNGGESDVDCGGTCVKCANGRSCYLNKDCLSNHCCPTEPPLPGYCEAMSSPCLLLSHGEMPQ